MATQVSVFLETDLINMVSGGHPTPAKVKRRLSAKRVQFKKVPKRGSISKDKKLEIKRKDSVDMGCRIRHFIDEVEEKFITKHRGSTTEDGTSLRNNSARLRKLIEKEHPHISNVPRSFHLPKSSTLPALFGSNSDPRRGSHELFVPEVTRSRRGSARIDTTLSSSQPLGDGRKSPLIILPKITSDFVPVVVIAPARSRRMSVSSPHRLSPSPGSRVSSPMPRRESSSPTTRRQSSTPTFSRRASLSAHHHPQHSDKAPKIRLGSGRSASMWDVSQFEEETAHLRNGGKRARSGRLRVPHSGRASPEDQELG